MTRHSPFLLAALFAAILGAFGMAPAKAAGIPAGPALTLDAHSKAETSEVRYRHHHRVHRHHFHHRRHYYRPHFYGPGVYGYRRCVTRPRIVWTPYGYVRRWVRVCRY